MEGIAWADLDANEQRAIAILGAGLSIELCDPGCSPDLTAARSDRRLPFDGCRTRSAEGRRFRRTRGA